MGLDRTRNGVWALARESAALSDGSPARAGQAMEANAYERFGIDLKTVIQLVLAVTAPLRGSIVATVRHGGIPCWRLLFWFSAGDFLKIWNEHCRIKRFG